MRGSTFTYDIDTIDVVRNEREPSRITNATTARDATRCLGYIFRYAVLCCAVLHVTYMLYTLHLSSLFTASLKLETSIRRRLLGRPIGTM
jgi:hypothetical protein